VGWLTWLICKAGASATVVSGAGAIVGALSSAFLWTRTSLWAASGATDVGGVSNADGEHAEWLLEASLAGNFRSAERGPGIES
jgi:hypothetical protein